MQNNIKPIVESYNINEEHLYIKPYLFIKGYATGRNFKNTLLVLPLARKTYDGQYRKVLREQMLNDLSVLEAELNSKFDVDICVTIKDFIPDKA